MLLTSSLQQRAKLSLSIDAKRSFNDRELLLISYVVSRELSHKRSHWRWELAHEHYGLVSLAVVLTPRGARRSPLLILFILVRSCILIERTCLDIYVYGAEVILWLFFFMMPSSKRCAHDRVN